MESFYAVIIAGGGGTRLWPLSRTDSPKQLLPLLNSKSMFVTSVERLAPLFTPDRIYVVAGRNHMEILQSEETQIPSENFVAEPYGRDTAPAIGLALATIAKRDPQATIAILSADHHIGKPELFRDVLESAYHIAQKEHIVTLGISPSYPAIGFGYIRQGRLLGESKGFNYYVSEAFTEKPDVVRATQFISSGRYSWNSGMFIWRADRALEEFAKQNKALYEALKRIQDHIDEDDYETELDLIWEEMPKISIDFAIMEGAKDIVVIPIDIGWSDVGSWASLYDVLQQDRFGNCAKGDAVDKRVILDTTGSLVYSDRLTVLIGLKDIIIVDTDDAILVCHKDRAQDVKQVVNYLKQNGNKEYL
ncbi:mannose-1-phosphate guanylyltransferase [Anaerolineales bacterium]